MTHEQIKELTRCANSFRYFAENYVKVFHPTRGLIPIDFYPFHQRLVRAYENNRFVLFTKFRQGGFTTITQAYTLWKAMFSFDQSVMTVTKTDRESIEIGRMTRKMLEYMPDWIQPRLGRNNDHLLEFQDTSSRLTWNCCQASRGRSVSLLVVDEAAFIHDMDQHWRAFWPCLSTGGHAIVYSSINSYGNDDDNWFENLHKAAIRGENQFFTYEADYWEQPEYQDQDWLATVRENLGEKGFKIEVLQEYPYIGRLKKAKKFNPVIQQENDRQRRAEAKRSCLRSPACRQCD